jgi:hypothetical protein
MKMTKITFFQCMEALQASPLPESAEILDILNRIEFEGLFFSHDKLAERQVSSSDSRQGILKGEASLYCSPPV